MKLRETSDEFANVNLTSTQERLDALLKKQKSLGHLASIYVHKLQPFQKYFKQYLTANNLTHEDFKNGLRVYERSHKSNRPFVLYGPMSPNEERQLANIYRNIVQIDKQAEKIKGTIQRTNLQMKKEAGTYVSRQTISDAEMSLLKDLVSYVDTFVIADGFAAHPRGSKTKQNGLSRLYFNVAKMMKSNSPTTLVPLVPVIKKNVIDWLTYRGYTKPKIKFDGREFALSVPTSTILKSYHNPSQKVVIN